MTFGEREPARHQWMVLVPYEVTPEDGLRLAGLKPYADSDAPPSQLAAEEKPHPDDARPFLGLHNARRDLVAVGCYACEQPITETNVHEPCPGGPAEGATEARPDGSGYRLAGVGRNELCPCGSGKKYKHCHGG